MHSKCRARFLRPGGSRVLPEHSWNPREEPGGSLHCRSAVGPLAPFSPSYGVYRKGFQGQRRHLEESQPSVPTEAVSVLPSQLSAGHCSVRGHQRSSFRPSQWEARRPRALPSLNGLPPASGSQRSSAQASPPAFVVKCPPHWVHGPQKREGHLCSRSARSALGPGGEGVGVQNCVSRRVKSGVSLLHT